MIFERFEVPGLAHYSYAVGCREAGELAVVDPKRDVDTYVDFAAAHNVRVAHVLETHIHADYASGARQLAEQTGAALHVSKYDRGETYEVSFPHHDLNDGDRVEFGRVRLVALHTPGHTPEHISLLVYDTAESADQPVGLLSGDFLFVGSLGRPDLLGEEAKHALAGQLFDSVRTRIADLPDGLAVYPAHGAGSMCGAGMAAQADSTLGEQRVTNPYLKPDLDRDSFVRGILDSVPPFPPYYRRMKQVNAAGAGRPPTAESLRAIQPAELRELTGQGHVVVDLRGYLEFGAGHIPGSFGIGLSPNLATWAAWVVPYDTPIVFVCDDRGALDPAVRAFSRVGLDGIVGYLDGGIATWQAAGFPISTTSQLAPTELAARLRAGDPVRVLDVRSAAEFAAGHIDGAIHVMCGELAEQLDAVPRDGAPLAVVCGGGYRSTIAASVLARAGYQGVMNVPGGMSAVLRSEASALVVR